MGMTTASLPLQNTYGEDDDPRDEIDWGHRRGQHDVMLDIAIERDRQDKKWGPQYNLSYYKWITILGEEFGEAARECFESEHMKDPSAVKRLRKELIEVAAVAVAAIEDIDGRRSESED